MTPASSFSGYAARLRQFMAQSLAGAPRMQSTQDEAFNELALELFALQFAHNAAYRTWCDARRVSPSTISHWSEIPAFPASGFKELEVTNLPEMERTHVFHSSGTSEQRPSRHFHNAESLALYEASVLAWFRACLLGDVSRKVNFLMLTPTAVQAPHSSLVHMFETLRREFGSDSSVFCGGIDASGAWSSEYDRVIAAMQTALEWNTPVMLMGTAFNYVHLLDQMSEQGQNLHLPAGSRILETGGYKGRSRVLPKSELHELITERLGVEPQDILCEYGMSELSSQAYDIETRENSDASHAARHFRFPPWTRACVLSPETGREVEEGQTGLIRIYDLANARSVLAVQTEDLGIRRGHGFELLGRAVDAEPRGCSLMAASH